MDDARILTAGPPQPRTGFYFGWRIVLAMFLATMMIYGNTLFGFIILTDPLAREFGWSSAATGSLVSAMWLIAPLALVIAPAIHRFGAFTILIGGLLLQVVCLALVGSIDSFWQLYLLRVVMGIGKVVSIVAVPVMVTTWFSRRFSTAMAMAWCGGSFGGFVMAPATERLLSFMTWREAALSLGALMGVATLVIFLLCRGARSPAAIGLGLDGDPRVLPLDPAGGPSENAEPKVQASELRSINFVTAAIMAVALMLSGIGALAALSQAPSLIEAGGISAQLAATFLGLTAAASAFGQVTIGWLLDRWKLDLCNLLVALLLATGLANLILLQHDHGVAAAAVGALALGVGIGANEMLWITLTKRQFGSRLFAYTYGGWSCALAAGYALGGPVGGWAFDRLPPTSFPLLIMALYLPALTIAVWRPGKRDLP